ncbi:MAG TPA: glucose 1-dehydrogenase [Bryobacteraceae bacterium]|jgi:2-dehydro-3-deoxy-L-rhamnonate dehydrogenase (NAD+)|nr:glucose 1-dehydrogenase [Bryobacteraceae bacterium]
MFLLTGQTAIVTGAATGIGEAIARRLARAGATIAVADLDAEGAAAVAASIGGESFGIGIDISRAGSVGDAVAAVLARRGRIDVLVNNAGIAGKAAPLWEQTDEDWQRIIAVNLTGVFNTCRAVIPHMRERKYGRIVNIASIAGKEGNPNMTGYSATKAAVIGFTKSVGKEVAMDGICVNSISPAVIRTRILDQLTQAQVDYMTERIPMRRTGTPEEIAAVAHFLASPDCSFVTAQCYDASGGRATY